MVNARKLVFNALIKMDKDEGFSNLTLDSALSSNELSSKDRSFATVLFYGVLERRITLDALIAKFSSTPLKKIHLNVLCALRVGLYQLAFMDRIPESAAVNETVKLISKGNMRKSTGFVNAILRSYIRESKNENLISQLPLNVQYSVSKEMFDSFVKDYSLEVTMEFLSSFFEKRHFSIRVNTTKISLEDYCKALEERNIDYKLNVLCENAVTLSGAGSVENLYGFEEGYFHVQDISSQICAKIASRKTEGFTKVLDICAAPGGKSFSIAQNLGEHSEVYSLDLYEHKIKLISEGAKRLGLNNIKSFVNDASVYNGDLTGFDTVLCDLPCSGWGNLASKPEIRYNPATFLDKVSDLQYDLLCISSQYCKDGGLLVYSTCTLRKAENNEIATKFLSEHCDFEAVEINLNIPRVIEEDKNMITLFPHKHKSNGFFISCFQKKR